LEAVGLRFEVVPSAVAERDHDSCGSREETVVYNAIEKARDVASGVDTDALVIGADTLVFADDRALGKPESVDQARRMLRMLSGTTHQVYTGLAVVHTRDGREETGYEKTDVTFRDLSDEDIIPSMDPAACLHPGSTDVFTTCWDSL